MGFRDMLHRLFTGGERDLDPDEPVEIGVIPIADGHEAFDIRTNVASGYRILVPPQQAEQAARRLDEILTA